MGKSQSSPKESKYGIKAILAIVAPWLVILGLLYIAFFTHPGTLGKTVQPLPISNLDRFYGATKVNDHDVWLVGNFGKIIHSKDGGHAWTIQSTPTLAALLSVAAWNATDAVAVGNQATILLTQDGGAHWKEAASVPLSGTFNKLLNVRILSNGQAWAVGENGAILKSDDRGTTWEREGPPKRIIFKDVAGVGRRRWVVGEFGTVLFSDDGGSKWTKQKTGVDSTLNAICFRDAQHGVVVGLDGTLLTTSNGGQSWTKVDLATNKHFFAVTWNGQRWLATGGGGMVASSDVSARQWRVGQLGRRNFSWHTAAIPIDSGWLLAGSSVGFYTGGSWKKISSKGLEQSNG